MPMCVDPHDSFRLPSCFVSLAASHTHKTYIIHTLKMELAGGMGKRAGCKHIPYHTSGLIEKNNRYTYFFHRDGKSYLVRIVRTKKEPFIHLGVLRHRNMRYLKH